MRGDSQDAKSEQNNLTSHAIEFRPKKNNVLGKDVWMQNLKK